MKQDRWKCLQMTQMMRNLAIISQSQAGLQDAWLHGSDEYWKKNHDQAEMTVIDLTLVPDDQAESTLFKSGSYIF